MKIERQITEIGIEHLRFALSKMPDYASLELNKSSVKTIVAAVDRAAAEIAVLRRVVRAADYLAELAWDPRYAEARAALNAFDRAAQEKLNAV